jgi:uncharacterized protein
MPPLPDPLVELDQLLAALPNADEAPLLTELDGFLAGTLIAPEPIPEDRWLPLIWAGESGAPEGFEPPPRLIALAKARRAEIAGALIAGGLRYAPVYDYDGDDVPMWELWIEGFARALPLWGGGWTDAIEGDDEDLGAALMGLALLVAVARDPEIDPAGEGDDLIVEAPVMIPYLVETVYRRRHGLARVVMAPEPPPVSPKVGRNDPCPCGSGRKFKKCCGSA